MFLFLALSLSIAHNHGVWVASSLLHHAKNSKTLLFKRVPLSKRIGMEEMFFQKVKSGQSLDSIFSAPLLNQTCPHMDLDLNEAPCSCDTSTGFFGCKPSSHRPVPHGTPSKGGRRRGRWAREEIHVPRHVCPFFAPLLNSEKG